MASRKVPYYFWRPFDFRNFGDELSPAIAERIMGRAVTAINDRDRSPKLLGAGSILDHARAGDFLWGTGTKGFPAVPPPVTAFAVRGPLTRDCLLKAGIACPEVFGDPALLVPRLFPEIRREKTRAVGVVLHYRDTHQRFLTRLIWPLRKRFSPTLIDVGLPPERVLRELAGSEFIVSSSLHGVVVADAYGIPCQLISGAEYRRNPLKFRDYFLSVGREWREPPTAFDLANPQPLPPARLPDLDRLLAAFPRDLLA